MEAASNVPPVDNNEGLYDGLARALIRFAAEARLGYYLRSRRGALLTGLLHYSPFSYCASAGLRAMILRLITRGDAAAERPAAWMTPAASLLSGRHCLASFKCQHLSHQPHLF